MSIEAAMNKLADALNRYADVIEQHGTSVAIGKTETTGKTDDKSADKPKTAAQKKAEAAAAKKAEEAAAKKAEADAAAEEEEEEEEEDPFADAAEEEEEEETSYSAADIRKAILAVRDKGGEKKNAEAAKKIIAAVGAKSMGEIDEAKYAKVMELCKKAMK